MDLQEKKIFITGGSSGIGKSFIKELIKYKVTQIGVIGRGKDSLEALKKEFPSVDFLLVHGDISSLKDVDKAIEAIIDTWKGLDILINNAGVVSAGLLDKISDEDIINQININLTGLILLTKKCLPLLKQSEQGAIINVSSGLGYIAMPFYSVYSATKAAVRQFSDAMRRELHDFPIHIMTVYPTVTDTNMMTNAKVESEMDSPDKVARESIEGLLKGEINVIFGGEDREENIKTNLLEPEKIDHYARERFEELKGRTENHRSM